MVQLGVLRWIVVAAGWVVHFGRFAASFTIECSNEVCYQRVSITALPTTTYINSRIGTEDIIGFPEMKMRGPGFIQLKNVNTDCSGKVRLNGPEGEIILNSEYAMVNATAAITELTQDDDYILTMEDAERCLQYLIMASDDLEALNVLKKKAEDKEKSSKRAVQEVDSQCGPRNFTLEAMVLLDGIQPRLHRTAYQNLLNSLPSLKLGFATYTDTPDASNDFCYHRLVSMQPGGGALSALLAANLRSSEGRRVEGSNPLESLLHVLSSSSEFSSGSTDVSGRYVLRMAIVHVYPKGQTASSQGSLPPHPGFVSNGVECGSYEQPSPGQVGKLFRESGVSVLFVVHGDQYMLEEYQQLLADIGCPGFVTLAHSDGHSLTDIIDKGITQLCSRM